MPLSLQIDDYMLYNNISHWKQGNWCEYNMDTLIGLYIKIQAHYSLLEKWKFTW